MFAEEEPIIVFVDGEMVSFDIDPIQKNGITLVQFKPVFDKLGLSIEWDQETQSIIGSKQNLEIKLTLNSTEAMINGEIEILQIAPTLIENNTFVPLRFVGEASWKLITWDSATKTVQIGKQFDIQYVWLLERTLWKSSNGEERYLPTLAKVRLINKTIESDYHNLVIEYEGQIYSRKAEYRKNSIYDKYQNKFYLTSSDLWLYNVDDFTDKALELISKAEIDYGMTEDMVILSWGYPNYKYVSDNYTQYKYITKDLIMTKTEYLWFYDGVLTKYEYSLQNNR
ncbi:stalk domain-containing protein [Chengkuizengella axinellae]|uniref:Stalk domain-containing protein n=1 Tax=Chengkuizengella axinellae TaxID=3064388 RepID=A0ABT9J3E8_9BACL|nr:stalk domain-containing protein [Chengkuizengella sp. 2205SS18-9]MDP5276145.1 stalk domain-containing protein [Chengkuizengella sp. 2205SS18-9]